MKRISQLHLTICISLMFFSQILSAQENYEIQVYESGLVPVANTMFELHSNTTLKRYRTDNLFSQNYFRETVEITHGFSRWFEIGSYLFTNIGLKGSSDIVGAHIRPRIALPSDAGFPLGLSLSSEIGYVKGKYSDSKWSLELRPIIDKKWDRLLLAMNAVFSIGLDRNVSKKPDLGSAFKISYDVSSKVAAGLEYYGGYGPLNNLSPSGLQQHQLYGSVDIDFGPMWEFNSGLGWSLNNAADRLLVKFILGRRFAF
jgi:hypothetical protein